MNRLLVLVCGGVASLGWPGALGIGLLAVVGGFYFSTFSAEKLRLEDLRRELSSASERRSAPAESAAPEKPSDRLAAFYAFFPRPNDLPDLMEKVYAAAKRQGLQLEQGEYRVVKDSAGALMQFQITLPVHGTYPQIRKFVNGAMAEVSTLSLDSIHFERQKVGDATVEAKVKLSVHLGRGS